MVLTGRLMNRQIVESWARYDDLDQPAPNMFLGHVNAVK